MAESGRRRGGNFFLRISKAPNYLDFSNDLAKKTGLDDIKINDARNRLEQPLYTTLSPSLIHVTLVNSQSAVSLPNGSGARNNSFRTENKQRTVRGREREKAFIFDL